jgi:ribosome maturation factor RimP
VGERLVTTELRLVEVLSELAGERARVVLVPVDGADAVAGELRAVGRDVVTVRTDGDPPAIAYVPLRSVAEVTLG